MSKLSSAALLAVGLSSVCTVNAAPTLIKDVNAGPQGSEVIQTIRGTAISQSSFMSLGNGKAVTMLQENGVVGLYVTDGTAAGTSKLVELPSDSAIDSTPHVLNGFVYFWIGSAPTTNSSPSDTTLWRSDGTIVGTGEFMLDDGTKFYSSLNSLTANVAKLGNRLLLTASTDLGGARKLWVTDGSTEGTETLGAYCDGGGYGSPVFSESDSDGLNGYQYFGATNCGSTGTELWRTNGTDEGTERVASISTDANDLPPMYMKIAGSKVFFRGMTPEFGMELWVSDGTEAGTQQVADLNVMGSDSRPIISQAIDDKVLFSATTSGRAREYWVSDGTEAGTLPLTDFGTETNAGYIGYAVKMANIVYFIATSNNSSTVKLMRSNGTPAGTTQIKEFASVGNIAALGTQIFLQAKASGGNGIELWESDGTGANTRMSKDIFAGSSDSTPHALQKLSDSKLIFLATNGSSGVEPWLYDPSTGPDSNGGDSSGGGGGSSPFTALLLLPLLGRFRKTLW